MRCRGSDGEHAAAVVMMLTAAAAAAAAAVNTDACSFRHCRFPNE